MHLIIKGTNIIAAAPRLPARPSAPPRCATAPAHRLRRGHTGTAALLGCRPPPTGRWLGPHAPRTSAPAHLTMRHHLAHAPGVGPPAATALPPASRPGIVATNSGLSPEVSKSISLRGSTSRPVSSRPSIIGLTPAQRAACAIVIVLISHRLLQGRERSPQALLRSSSPRKLSLLFVIACLASAAPRSAQLLHAGAAAPAA